MAEFVFTKRKGRVAEITVDRPDVMNALNPQVATELRDAIRDCAQDRGIRCMIIAGGGDTFMAGGDVKFFHQSLDRLQQDRDSEELAAMLDCVHEAIRFMRAAPQPVVAKVRGAAAGYGLSLMASCDLAIAAEDAMFTVAYTQIGATPDGGCTYHLPRILGIRKTLELILLNQRFGAAEAKAIGLVNQVVPAAELDAATDAIADRLCAGAADAFARAKRLVYGSLDADLDAQLAAEEEAFKACVKTADFAEGVSAFVEKRRPKFR